ncbi:NUDIX domain-containing protein [Bradyrhizobium sp. ISRA464]|uniref:NUDIX hydrolase n=2 Tax=unclassified Bradyrhizobium TaxID=2631580 RepID=UPI0024789986|nr:NUDIX domain-containing protein [Bradyrhizobium sp. ISRA464]WGS29307.1 NUDIX domain-containing protein [Bradyrhizobium sp. ISRA464]
MARTPVLAAGGIVLRREAPPRIAVVRLRKRNEWVLPKGKLDDGETPRAAAEREVLEETGHAVDVHEFLGTLVYDSGGRSKVVHYWRMEAGGRPVRELMSDIREVDWLPLELALARLSRGYERAFLENVGPIALQAAALAERERRVRARAAAAERRRSRAAVQPAVEEEPAVETPVVAETPAVVEIPDVMQTEPDAPTEVPQDAEMDAREAIAQSVDQPAPPVEPPSFAPEIEPAATAPQPALRKNLIQRVRDWLHRAA